MIRLLGERLKLVPAELESTMLRQPRPFVEGAGFSEAARAQGLFFDLSYVEWVELGAAAQVCLLAEAARLNDVRVVVALPYRHLRITEVLHATESQWLGRQIERHRTRRVEAYEFLDRLHFTAALDPSHAATAQPIEILHNFDARRDGAAYFENDGGQEEVRGPVYRYEDDIRTRDEFAVPLRWVTSADKNAIADVAGELERVVVEYGTADRVDATTLSNVVLHELVDNVRHAGREHILIGAWVRPAHAPLSPTEYLDAERPFVGWANAAPHPAVELVVGDSGRGLVAVLGEAFDAAHRVRFGGPNSGSRASDVAAWAFDRYSTSNPPEGARGTRGLYRVDRVVKKHLGLITVRTANKLVGWDHGGPAHDKLIVHAGTLSYMPGTVLRVQLLGASETFPRRAKQPEPSPLELTFIQAEVRADGRLTEETVQRLVALGQRFGNRPGCAVMSFDQPPMTHEALQILFRDVSEKRHPFGVALVGLGVWDVVDNARDSVNADVDRKRLGVEDADADHALLADPVLLLGQGPNDIGWVGAPTALAALLTQMATGSGHLTIDQFYALVPPEVQREVRRALRSDTSIVRVGTDDVTLLLHPDVIFEEVGRAVADHVTRTVGEAPRNTVFRTPSLAIVKQWLDPTRLFPQPVGHAAAMAALSRLVRASNAWGAGNRPDVILADSGVERRYLAALRAALGVDRVEVIPGETGSEAPETIRLVDEGQRVLVYADVLLTSEAARRCLSQIVRDGATAVMVACAVDGRDDAGHPLEVWGIDVPVTYLTNQPLLTRTPEGARIINVDPGGRISIDDREPAMRVRSQDRRPNGQSPRYAIPPALTAEYVAHSSALRFGHIGEQGGRHFTFYIDAASLLKVPEVVGALRNVVDEWCPPGTGRLAIWYPEPEPKLAAPAHSLAWALRQARPDARSPVGIRRQSVWGGWSFSGAEPPPAIDDDLVVIDWGSIDGTTLIEMTRLATQSGARRVLVCVCLSQLDPVLEDHLLAVNSYWTTQRVAPVLSQMQFDDAAHREEAAMISREVPVEVRFLSALPVPAFRPKECPVCMQLTRVSAERYPTRLLGEIASWHRTTRLYRRSREEAVHGGPKDIDGRKLTAASVRALLAFRGELELGLRSTRARHDLVERLNRLTAAEALDLFKLLVIEGQWLRRAPLVFEAYRKRLANLAAEVACAPETSGADRLNALIVLRSCSKSVFAREAATIFMVVYTDDRVLAQLLYGMYTYLSQPYLVSPAVVQPIRDALVRIREHVEEGQRPSSRAIDTIDALERRAQLRAVLADHRHLEPEDAWGRLRSAFGDSYVRHGVSELLRTMYSQSFRSMALRLHGGDLPENELHDFGTLERKVLIEKWNGVEQFLTSTLIPLTSRLDAILGSEAVRRHGGMEVLGRLLDLVREQTPPAEWPIATLIKGLASGARTLASPATWADYEAECRWLIDGILQAGAVRDDFTLEPSPFVRLLRSCPADLRAAFESAAAGLEPLRKGALVVQGLERIPNVHVFYPGAVLTDLATVLLENTYRHRDRTLGAGPPTIDVTVSINADDVRIETVSFGTVQSEQSGVALDRHRSAIEAALGKFSWSPRPTRVDASFSTVAVLRRISLG